MMKNEPGWMTDFAAFETFYESDAELGRQNLLH